jgi:hypothetical protein
VKTNQATGIATFELETKEVELKTSDYYSLQVMKWGARELCRRDDYETESDEVIIESLEAWERKIEQSTGPTPDSTFQIGLDELGIASASAILGQMMAVKDEYSRKMKDDLDLGDDDGRWCEIHQNIKELVDFTNGRNESWFI